MDCIRIQKLFKYYKKIYRLLTILYCSITIDEFISNFEL